MKVAKAVFAVFYLLITTPIWYYLMYEVLKRVDASELMWFLFWIYFPLGIIGAVLQQVIQLAEKNP